MIMLVGHGTEMQKSFKQNRNLLRKRTFLNKSQPRKGSNRQTNKKISKEAERRFDSMKTAADTKAIRMILTAMVLLAMGFYMFYKIMA